MRKFVAKTDLEVLNLWHERHGKPTVCVTDLPHFGLIEPDVAIGFVYLTDSNFALLDGFATNPDAASEARHRALDEIILGLMDVAKHTGRSKVMGMVNDLGLCERLVRLGWINMMNNIKMYGKDV